MGARLNDWWRRENLIDTLRLSTDDYFVIISELNEHAREVAEQQPGGKRRKGGVRRHKRMTYWRKQMAVLLCRAEGGQQAYTVLPHNVSQRGAAFLHGFFVQTGTPCEVALETVDREMMVVGGTVVRCRYIRSRVHDIGVAFRTEVSLERLVPELAAAARDAQQSTATRFSGTAICVDANPDDREMTEFLISELGLTVHPASSTSQALDVYKRNPADVVFIRLNSPPVDVAQITNTLRERRKKTFIVALSGDEPAGARNQAELESAALSAGCDCVVHLPLSPDMLTEVFTGVLPQAAAPAETLDPLISDHWHNVSMRPLIRKFVGRLETRVGELERFLKVQALDEFESACGQLAGSAENYGYGSIATRLRKLSTDALRGQELNALRPLLEELRALCLAARQVRD